MQKRKGKVIEVVCNKNLRFFDGLTIYAGEIVRIDERSFSVINNFTGNVSFRETDVRKAYIYAAALLQSMKGQRAVRNN